MAHTTSPCLAASPPNSGRLMAIDGFEWDAPGTEENAAAFGFAGTGADDAGRPAFPKVRVVTVSECASRAVVGAAMGAVAGKGAGEQSLAASSIAGWTRTGSLSLTGTSLTGRTGAPRRIPAGSCARMFLTLADTADMQTDVRLRSQRFSLILGRSQGDVPRFNACLDA